MLKAWIFGMQTSVQCRPQERTLGMVMKEVDEDLAIFLEMRRSEKDMNDQLAKCNTEELDQQLGIDILDVFFQHCQFQPIFSKK